MVSLILRKLVFVIAPLLVAIQALPQIIPPSSGNYRIQNAATGLYLDLDGADASTLPDYLTELSAGYADTLHVHCSDETNQEWFLEFDGTGPNGPVFGLQSNSVSLGRPFVLAAVNPNGGALVLTGNPTTASELNVTAVPGGFNICNIPLEVGCFTGPSVQLIQVNF
ncbi:hypothetical protein BDP27DRAFT_1438456 [Rhodocollybia butyracea]|uniref:Uncharacterized protein n=1 Tax=Rhodocollybia butyracea TaxID=206335 RepID=A0A9P5TWK8_9AGAR|nr:hypothetical protein BDP27DRAFT_1438456 [Rhodocollybia butyracea]